MQKFRPSLRALYLLILSLGLGGILNTSCILPNRQTNEINPQVLGISSAIRISVMEEGIYQVSLAELGWENVNSNTFQLFHRDQPQPLWITGKGSEARIHFYGQPSTSIYTNENVYLLQTTDSPGTRITVRANPSPVANISPSEHITATIRAEQNLFYTPLVETGDHWFWSKLIAPQTLPFEIDLTDVATGAGKMRVELWGVTKAPSDPDHHVLLHVNGQLVADATWDGQTRHTVEAGIPARTLKDGVNAIEIETPGDTESPVEIAFVDWIEIDYARQAQAEDDRLTFTTSAEAVQLSGFGEAVTLFDLTTPETITLTTLPEDSPIFLGEKGHRYIAVGPQGYRQPDRIEPAVLEPDLRDPGIGAEYIAIGPEDLLTSLGPLMAWRISQNLSVMAISDKAIYDQFNGGMPEPEAIRDFLTFAVDHWQTAPRYILLVGDTTYDFRGHISPAEGNRLPTIMVPTNFGGETASDVSIAQTNDDPWPDIAIGRIPARTPEQATTFVEKTLRYEQGLFGEEWNQDILAIADGQDSIFQEDAQNFLDLFPPEYHTTLITPQARAAPVNQEVQGAIENGNLITTYFGHGSLTMWGKDRLFTIENSTNLSNADRLPIMLNVTCLTGLFTHPTQESLAESLLWNPNGGAVAILAPTSLTLLGAQRFLANAFVEAFLQAPGQRLGDIVLYAWRQAPSDSASVVDVMNTFLLFGDPALRLPSHNP